MKHYSSVILAGEIWSSNLGDGLIAENLRFLLNHIQPDLQVNYLDISGRGPERAVSEQREVAGKAKFLRSGGVGNSVRNVSRFFVKGPRRSHEWSSLISEADAVLIGGGQLLMDNDLDFPLKISRVARLAYNLGKDVFIVSCGVTENWSPIASKLFSDALMPAAGVTVRDSLSLERLANHLPGKQASLSSDPAVWSAEVYGRSAAEVPALVGLGIMNIDAMSSRAEFPITQHQVVDFWIGFADFLRDRRVGFELFTNGSPNDFAFAQHVAHAISERLSFPAMLAPSPESPASLARSIGRYTAVVASRLHAHIVATAYAIPSLGLGWDSKIRAFFEDTGREQLVFEPAVDALDGISEAFDRILGHSVDGSILERKKELVLEHLRNLLAAE